MKVDEWRRRTLRKVDEKMYKKVVLLSLLVDGRSE